MKAYIFLAEGFEEIEAIAPLDILRRAEIETITVSITSVATVNGAHCIPIVADTLFSEIQIADDDFLILPGGMPGTTHLMEHTQLNQLVKLHTEKGNAIAAICAAPSLLGKLNLLHGIEAISYPGFEQNLIGAIISEQSVVKSNNIITGKGPGVAISFALKLVETIKGKDVADRIASQICM